MMICCATACSIKSRNRISLLFPGKSLCFCIGGGGSRDTMLGAGPGASYHWLQVETWEYAGSSLLSMYNQRQSDQRDALNDEVVNIKIFNIPNMTYLTHDMTTREEHRIFQTASGIRPCYGFRTNWYFLPDLVKRVWVSVSVKCQVSVGSIS